MSEINLLTNEQKLDQKLHIYFKFINVFLVLCFLGVSGLTYYYYTLYAPLLEENRTCKLLGRRISFKRY